MLKVHLYDGLDKESYNQPQANAIREVMRELLSWEFHNPDSSYFEHIVDKVTYHNTGYQDDSYVCGILCIIRVQRRAWK